MFKKILLTHRDSRLVKWLWDLNAKISVKPYQASILFFMRNCDAEIRSVQCELDRISIKVIHQGNYKEMFTDQLTNKMVADNESQYTRASLWGKLDNGGILFIALDQEGNIVHHTWLEQGHIYIQNIYLHCSLSPGIGYFASSYTPSSFRKKGIGKYVRSLALRYCQDKGMKRVILTIDAQNVPSMRLALSMGFRQYQKVTLTRFLGAHYYRIFEHDGGSVISHWGNEKNMWDYFHQCTLGKGGEYGSFPQGV